MKTLKEQWSAFCKVMFGPFNLILLLSLWGLFHISGKPDSGVSPDVMFVLITVAAAVLGGRIAQQWAEVNDQGIVEARGRAAVRNLKVLLRNIAALESRLREFRKDEKQIKDNPDVTSRNYDEAIGRCGLLEEEAVNSIENWTDIVPEADIKTQIGRISELQAELGTTARDLAVPRDALQEVKGKSAEETALLKSDIKRMEAEQERLAKELRDKSFGLGIATSSGQTKLSDFLLGVLGKPVSIGPGDQITIDIPDSGKITVPDAAKISVPGK
jgi:hypothetical protein